MDCSKMTDQEFREILEDIINELNAAEILSYGDVYSIFSEELNNEVLSRWEEKQKEEV